MVVFAYLFVAAATVLLAFVIQNHYKNRRYWELFMKFNGDAPLPIIGNALSFGTNSEGILKGLTKFWENHNRSTYRFIVGSSTFVGVNEPETIEVILGSTKEITKMHDYDFYKGWLGEGLLISTGEKWRRRRKIITPTFHYKILEQFLDVFNDKGDIFMDKLSKKLGKTFNVYTDVTLYALDVICETAMGTNVDAQNDTQSGYVKAVYELSEVLMDRSFSAWKRYPLLYRLSSNYSTEMRLLKYLHNLTNSVIESRRIKLNEEANVVKNKKNDEDDIGLKNKTAFLDLLLRSTTATGEPLSDEAIREEVDTFMFEGHDTTASCIAFAMYALANAPEAQDNAFNEQLSMFGSDLKKQPTYAELQEMNYLERCIKETLRIYPSVPFYGRLNDKDIILPGNKIIPPGTQVIVQTYFLGRNSKYFPDPLKFEPDRFLPENMKDKHPYAFVPFSAGPRNCIGQKFAMLEIKSVLSKVLRNYVLKSAGPEYEPILVPEVILRSKNGINMILERRKY